MSVYLDKISEVIDFINIRDKFTRFSFNIFDGVINSHRLLRIPTVSVGNTVLQIKKTGSALFKTPEGDVLVQISQNKQGRYFFKARKEGLNPVIFIEGKRRMSGAVWEVKVSNYLKEIISRSTDIKFGVKDSLWDLINRLCMGYLYCSGSAKQNLAVLSSVVSLVGEASARTLPITLLYPLPDISIDPGSELNQNIPLKRYYKTSDPNQNLELSIQQANGQPAPSWISIGMGPISFISSKYLSTYSLTTVSVNSPYAYFLTYQSGILNSADISDSYNPKFLGSLPSNPAKDCAVIGNNAYLADGYTLKVVDVSNPSNPQLITTKSFLLVSSPVIHQHNDYLYILNAGTYFGMGTNLTTFYIGNRTNPIFLNKLTFENSAYFPAISASGNSLVASTQESLYFLDITNPSTPVLAKRVPIVYYVYTSLVYKNNAFTVNRLNQLTIYNINNISNPIIVNTLYVFNSVKSLTARGNYIYASPCVITNTCTSGVVTVIEIANVLKAKIVATIPTAGSTFESALSGNQLYLANGGTGLTIYDASSRVLSGIPSSSDRGLVLLNVTAQNDSGESLADTIAVYVGAMRVAIPIPNQQTYVGNSSLLTLPAETFEFPNTNFIYSAELVGGLPLPPFIHFDSQTRTFLFTPKTGDQNTYRIQVTGDTGHSKTISTTFDLLVPNRAPLLAQPLANQTAYTGEFFDYVVSRNSFSDADSDQLQFSANLPGNNPLPGWLHFDPALLRFYGTPFGRNTYQIQMNADDTKGGMTTAIFTITVPNSAPFLRNPMGTQLASVGIPFSYPLNSETFYDFDNDVLTYSTSVLPSFLNFNHVTKIFTGTPQAQDIGIISINVYAEDPFGAKATAPFTLTVLSSSSGDLPPKVILQIPDMSVIAGIPFNTTFNNETFKDPQNQVLTYKATLEGGNPLPEGLNFDAGTFSLFGVVQTEQIQRITIKATNPNGGYAIDTFTFTAVDGTKYPPIVQNPLHDELATVGSPFFYTIPSNTFKELSGDSLTITVIQSGGLPLPKWLKWNPETHSFSGTPGPFDTNTYATREHTIDVWATDTIGSVKTSFKIIVNGESFFATFIKYGFSFASVAGSGIGIWKSRALIWNYLSGDKYHTGTQRANTGHFYNYKLKIPYKNLKEIRAYRSGKPLPQQEYLPEGLFYKANQLQGTPSEESEGNYTIIIIDHEGYLNEKFDLIIEKHPLPEMEMKC